MTESPKAPLLTPATGRLTAAALVALMLYAWLQVVPFLRTGGFHQNDFKHVWLGANILARGENPYDRDIILGDADIMARTDPRFASGIMPYVYLPFTGHVLWPLGKMSFDNAVITWGMINHALILSGIVLVMMASGHRWRARDILVLGIIVAVHWGITRQNNAGQFNAVLLFGYALVALGIAHRWPAAFVGGIAAFLALFKLSPGILLIYFIATRRYRHAQWMAIIGVALFAVSAILAGRTTIMAFLPELQSMRYGQSTWADMGMTFWRDAYNQSPNAFFHRLLMPTIGYHPEDSALPGIANGLTWLVTASVLGVLALLGRWYHRAHPAITRDPGLESSDRVLFSTCILASLLIPSLMWDHYLIQLFVPAILLWTHPAIQSRAPARWAIVAAIVVTAVPFEFSSLFLHFHPVSMAAWELLSFLGGAPIRLKIATVLGSPIQMPDGVLGRALFGSLKLWPVLILLGLAVWAETFARRIPKAANDASSASGSP